MRARVILDSVGKPAGFIAMSNHDGWLVEIHGIVAERPRSGVGRWALREALRWAFDDLGANRVWLEVIATNVNARRLYEDLGFIHEGTFRLGYRSGSGEYEDLAHYGILAREWRARATES
jgi:RimJ/RimL family protein N-acetyltransferase